MIVRVATAQDIPQLVDLRIQMFSELSEFPELAAAPELRVANEDYFKRTIDTSHARSWVAISEEQVVAIGTIVEFTRPPYVGNLTGRDAYVLNVFTLPTFRRRGLADQIFRQILAFAKLQGYGKVWLNASQDGRPLYEKHGFAPNLSVMEWVPVASG